MGHCALCRKGFKKGEQEIAIDTGGGPGPRVYVHKGECFSIYDQKYLSGEAAKKRGVILGLCFECERPVRQKDRCIVSRGCFSYEDLDHDEMGRILLTTVPCANEIFLFTHYQCPDEG